MLNQACKGFKPLQAFDVLYHQTCDLSRGSRKIMR